MPRATDRIQFRIWCQFGVVCGNTDPVRARDLQEDLLQSADQHQVARRIIACPGAGLKEYT
jgi:hypothetical protein